MQLVFKYWQKTTQRSARRCIKALCMYEQRVYASCFHALLHNAQQQRHKRQCLHAASQLYQRRMWRLCRAVLAEWRLRLSERQQKQRQADDLLLSAAVAKLHRAFGHWCASQLEGLNASLNHTNADVVHV